MVLSSAIILEDSNKKQYDIQYFPYLDFKLKLVVLEKHKNVARLFFLRTEDSDESDQGIPIPEDIKVKDFSDYKMVCELWPNTNEFYINIFHTYRVQYKGRRIYELNCEKKIQIYTFPKNIEETNDLVQEEIIQKKRKN